MLHQTKHLILSLSQFLLLLPSSSLNVSLSCNRSIHPVFFNSIEVSKLLRMAGSPCPHQELRSKNKSGHKSPRKLQSNCLFCHFSTCSLPAIFCDCFPFYFAQSSTEWVDMFHLKISWICLWCVTRKDRALILRNIFDEITLFSFVIANFIQQMASAGFLNKM